MSQTGVMKYQFFCFLSHVFFIIGLTASQVLRGSGKPYVDSLNSWSQWGHRLQFLLYYFNINDVIILMLFSYLSAKGVIFLNCTHNLYIQ